MLTSYTIDAVRLGSATVSSIYLGTTKVWPLVPQTVFPFWSRFSGNSCASVTLTSTFSSGIPSGILWGDGATSMLNSGDSSYRHDYGTGACTTPLPNYFTRPFNIDTTTYPSTGLGGPDWYRGSSMQTFGGTTAPDGTQNAILYRSLSTGSNSFVSQGYTAQWKPNTTYTFSVWAKRIVGTINVGNVISVTRNATGDRVSLGASGLITTNWKKFSLSLTTGPSKSGEATCYFFDGCTSLTQVALWGAGMTYST